MAEGDKFKGYDQIPAIALDDVFIILDSSNTTQSLEGSTVWGTGQQLIDFVNKYANASVENTYEDITQMLASQNEQGANNIQRVADASLDPTVTSGTAFYEYLGTTNSDLQDYVKLTSAQVEAVLSPIGWKTKIIATATTEASTNPANATQGNVLVVTEATEVTHLIFDSQFSKAMEKAQSMATSANFALNIYNVSNSINLRAVITSFEMVNSNANLKIGVSGLTIDEVTAGTVLQIDLPIKLPDYMKLPVTDYDDLFFDTSGNANPLEIADGNNFYGHPKPTKYVVGKVLNTTDFDPYNTDKAKLFIDSE